MFLLRKAVPLRLEFRCLILRPPGIYVALYEVPIPDQKFKKGNRRVHPGNNKTVKSLMHALNRRRAIFTAGNYFGQERIVIGGHKITGIAVRVDAYPGPLRWFPSAQSSRTGLELTIG